MRKVPVFLLAISFAALLAGCAGQTAPLGGAAQLGALSATAVTGEAVADEKQDVPAPADAPDVENPADPAQNAMPQENTQQPEGKADAPESEGQPDVPEQPTTPEQAVTPMPQPEPAPSESKPTPAPVQEPGPTPTPEPEPEPEYELADRWAAVSAANAYAVTQYGVITDGSLTLDNSAYRFPASVAADASQEVLEAKARDMVDYTFRQLMMQAGVDTLADAGFHCNVCIVEDGASLLIYVLYDG